MDIQIDGGTPLVGEVLVPADKSLLHRALMFAALADGTSTIVAAHPGADNLSTASALRQLGVRIDQTAHGFCVKGVGLLGLQRPTQAIDCGNSGTTMRLLSGILAGAGIEAELKGDPSLSIRPMGRVANPLRAMGARIEGQRHGNQELPSLHTHPGDFCGGTYHSPVASAQIKSCLLLGGLCGGYPVRVVEPTLSRDHTERMLTAMGVQVTQQTVPQGVAIDLVPGALRPFDIEIPGDPSSAAFIVAGALLLPGSDVCIKGVGLNPTRTGFFDVVAKMVGKGIIHVEEERCGEPVGSVMIQSKPMIRPQEGRLRIAGDLIPRLIDELVVLAAIACRLPGGIEIADAAELRVKESDRIAQTTHLLRAFGIEVTESASGMRIDGPQNITQADVAVGADHRLAMTGAALALGVAGRSRLRGFEVAEVSFPKFSELLGQLGASICIAQD